MVQMKRDSCAAAMMVPVDRHGPIWYQKGVNVVTSFTAPATRRRIGRIVAVGAVALVLAGSVASPAEAMRRSSAVMDANMVIGMCFDGGGTPDSYEYGNTIYVSCVHEDGTVTTIDYPYRN